MHCVCVLYCMCACVSVCIQVEVMTEEVEKKETQLGEALLAAQLRRPDMEAVARKLDDVMNAKVRPPSCLLC